MIRLKGGRVIDPKNNRDGGGDGRFDVGAKKFRRGQHEDRAKAFAARFQAVPHRGVKTRRTGLRRRKVQIEAAFDAGDEALVFGREIHRAAE